MAGEIEVDEIQDCDFHFTYNSFYAENIGKFKNEVKSMESKIEAAIKETFNTMKENELKKN